MVLIALLLIALVCLILGLVLASGPWLIASLAGSVVAGVVLWRQREHIGSRSPKGGRTEPASSTKTAPRQAPLVTGTAFTGKLGPGPAPAVPDVQVWVVDGEPEYHARDCPKIVDGDPESIPLAQAVEDGFRECSDCTPVPGLPAQVWVIDGRPDYHRKDCSRLSRGAAEEIARAQAVADGFTPCDQCAPDTPSDDSAEPTASASAGEPVTTVWVVDGRPRYHLQSCLIIKDQNADPIPIEQAAEDGFMPCSMCEPNVSRV